MSSTLPLEGKEVRAFWASTFLVVSSLLAFLHFRHTRRARAAIQTWAKGPAGRCSRVARTVTQSGLSLNAARGTPREAVGVGSGSVESVT